MIKNNLILIFILFNIFIVKNLGYKLKFYKSGSVDNKFEDYPPSTSSTTCTFTLPFSIETDTVPRGVSISYRGSEDYELEYVEDGKTLYSTFISSVIGRDMNEIVTFSFKENDILKSVNITLSCKTYNTKELKYRVLSSGLYYNNLALIFYFESLDIADKNVKLDLVAPVQYTQRYLGNKTFFISFLKNHKTFFESDTISVNLLINSQSFPIKIQSPYISTRNENLFEYELYPNSISTLFSSAILELNTTLMNNNQFSVFSDFEAIDEPYFIGTKNNHYRYLSPLYSNTKGQDVNFSVLFNGKNDSTKLIYQNEKALTFNYLEDKVTIDESKVTLEDFYYHYKFQLSKVNLPLSVYFGSPLKKLNYPFGYSSVSSEGNVIYSFTSSEDSSFLSTNITLPFNINKHSSSVEISPNNNREGEKIKIIKFNTSLLSKGRLLLELSLEYKLNKIRSLTIYQDGGFIYDIFPIDSILVGKENSNGNQVDVEINIPRIDIYKIRLTDSYLHATDYYFGSNYYYNINGQFLYLKNITNLDELPENFEYSKSLKSASFLYNDLKVTNIRVSNKMFIKLDNYPTDREIKVTFIYSNSRIKERKDVYYSNYNQSSLQYEIEFSIPKNINTGSISYIITLDSLDKLNYYSFALPEEYQLRIIESKNIDLMGPIVTDINVFNDLISNSLGWQFTIESINGFKQGYVTIRGSNDKTERNATIAKNDNSDKYQVKFESYCTVQEYEIIYAYFEDTESQFTEYNLLLDNKFNPFYKILERGNSDVRSNLKTRSDFACSSASPSEPELKELSFSDTIYFDSPESRVAKFKYTVYHTDGIANHLLPTVYISSYDFKFSSSSNTKVLNTNNSFTTFETDLQVPYLFGINSNVLVSVYGFTSKSGTVSGFSSDLLKNLGMKYSFSTFKGSEIIVITSSSTFSNTGSGGVWIYGRGFDVANEFQIQYEEDSSLGYKSITSNSKTSTTVYLPTIKATNYPIKIRAVDINGKYSSPFTIYPTIFNYIDQGIPSNTSSLCKGNPLCGGPSKGECYSTGCKCISPWIGLDCMSQIVKVPPPTINETNPSTNITIGDDISITSILSIVGIKELSINGDEVNKYLFEEWEYKLISNDSISIKYSYSSAIKKDNKIVSNITATLDWYKKESIVYFADQEITLNPSSIKYTIKITSYPFRSTLNTLQLIMKASIESTNSESCSDKQFGELKQDDSDYIKLQVDNYGFYGRFIKRCIIDDDKIIALTNTLLDSKMNNNITNNHQTSQSYIGINIPNYKDLAILDPDFSVILDSSSANKNCNSSGLTKVQLIGIIVGSVCLLLVLIIIISVIIYKSHGCIPIKIFFYKLFKKSKV